MATSDDGAGVASVLEIARALKARSRTRHAIILLSDDGKEVGSLGTRVFLQHHRWAKSIRAAINIDNRGTKGSSFLCETGDASAWLMDLNG
jgi:Zn-dependent M28 family amino/carboxypeptidase